MDFAALPMCPLMTSECSHTTDSNNRGDDNGSNNNSAIDLSRQLEKDRREAEVLNDKHCVDQQRFWEIQVANMMLTSSLTLQVCDVQVH